MKAMVLHFANTIPPQALTSCAYFVMAFWVLVFAMQTTAQSHIETYTTNETVNRTVCLKRSRETCSGWFWNYDCDTEYYCDYVIQTVIELKNKTRCQRGWVPYPACNDFDECHERTSSCEQICLNTLGSYTCGCKAGYRMASNGLSCNDVDECEAKTFNCSQRCRNTVGSYVCGCDSGYALASDNRACIDIDECSVQLDNCNTVDTLTCENTIGGYQCVCKPGFQQVGQRECADINECETLANNCSLNENLTCENIIGSYECVPLKSQSGISRNTMLIIIIVCIVVGVFLIIAAVVFFIICLRKRKRNKQAFTPNDAELHAENAYDNITIATDSKSSEPKMAKERKAKESVYDGLDRSINHKESFYATLEAQLSNQLHIIDSVEQTPVL